MPKHPPFAVPADESLQSWDDRQTAAALNISERTLQRLDAERAGPPFFRIGRLKRRTPDRVRSWIRSRTEEPPQAA